MRTLFVALSLLLFSLPQFSLPLRAQEPDPALVAAAQKEGKVMLYGEIITPTQRALKAAFEKKYPGVTVDLLYLSGAPMMNRVMSEQDAGRYVADTLMLDALRLPALLAKGIWRNTTTSSPNISPRAGSPTRAATGSRTIRTRSALCTTRRRCRQTRSRTATRTC